MKYTKNFTSCNRFDHNTITVNAQPKSAVSIYSIQGEKMFGGEVSLNATTLNFKTNGGVYLVKAGKNVSRVVVR